MDDVLVDLLPVLVGYAQAKSVSGDRVVSDEGPSVTQRDRQCPAPGLGHFRTLQKAKAGRERPSVALELGECHSPGSARFA